MAITDDGCFGSDKRVKDRDGEDNLLEWSSVEGMELGMVSDDFRKKVLGYGLTPAQILYRMPDHPSLLQTYVWQNYDLFRNSRHSRISSPFGRKNSMAPSTR
jgi:hypothetical protein